VYTGCFILNDMVNYLANRWFYWKIFRTKTVWPKEGIWRKCRLDLEWPCQNHIKVINVFL